MTGWLSLAYTSCLLKFLENVAHLSFCFITDSPSLVSSLPFCLNPPHSTSFFTTKQTGDIMSFQIILKNCFVNSCLHILETLPFDSPIANAQTSLVLSIFSLRVGLSFQRWYICISGHMSTLYPVPTILSSFPYSHCLAFHFSPRVGSAGFDCLFHYLHIT